MREQSNKERIVDKRLIFLILEKSIGTISPEDKALLSREQDLEYFSLTLPIDRIVTKSLDFFEKNKQDYVFVQNGSFVSFEHLNSLKYFLALSKNNLGYSRKIYSNLREVIAYKPEL